MEQSIVNRLASALQNRDSVALFEMLDPFAEIRDPLIGVVRRKYARHYPTVPLIFFNEILLQVFDVVESTGKVKARWKASLNLNQVPQKKIESTGSIVLELNRGKIYKVNLDFNYWRALGSLLGLRGYIFGFTSFLRKKIRRIALDQIKELVSQNETAGGKTYTTR